MHLGSHDVDFAAAGAQIANLVQVIVAHVVVVDVESGLCGEDTFGDFESAVCVVARHGTVPALAEPGAGDHVAFSEIAGAFVDHIPAVNLISVAQSDLQNAFCHPGVDF